MDMSKPDEIYTGWSLSAEEISIIQRAFGRIEGISYGCDTIVREELCRTVKQIADVLHLEEKEI